ncbi:flagellar brake protein [Aquipseudomonas ullengensis]|uniref:Flagellar brake protein n=1 Tax=Aquipseudomonas ullengensis TaxID=2759166 RepID=A0A7W4LMI6_9GAMM|nr:flagellar brake protein [Pseudomonas ullengensis]MBB2495860.1 flagellar brake protein [Pseudomonas ullengensis]
MSNPFLDEDGPQPPKVLSAPLEIFTNLRLLQQHNDPLVITFKDRNQRFQSFLVAADRERGVLALDELVPNDGERFLKSGEAFRVEGFHDGVRIAWDCEDPIEIGELEGARCYWCHLPEKIIYHQRRSAFRAQLGKAQMVNIELNGKRLSKPIKGQMLDISATGCRLRFPGDITNTLQPGQVYESLSASLPVGNLSTSIEVRHVRFDEKVEMTFVGARFHRLGGLESRQVERFVYQLQREARRTDKDD